MTERQLAERWKSRNDERLENMIIKRDLKEKIKSMRKFQADVETKYISDKEKEEKEAFEELKRRLQQ